MSLSRTTWALAALAAVLALLLLVKPDDGGRGVLLPTLPALDKDVLTRLEFGRQGETIVLQRDDTGWRITRPLQAEADMASVRSLLANYRKPVAMDIRVDDENHETYGVDDNAGVFFEAFGADSTNPLISMVVGNDVPGGSTLVRLSGGDEVYRARVGGRFRYDRSATEWRNRVLLGLDDASVEFLLLDRGRDRLTFRRDVSGEAGGSAATGPSPWWVLEDPSFPLDQGEVDGLVRDLCRVRAGEIHASDYGAGWEAPDAQVELALADGTTHLLTLVPEGESAALARVNDGSDVFRISAATLKRVLRPLMDYRDKEIFSLSRTRMDALVLEEGNQRVRLKQDLTTGYWVVVEPVAMDANLRLALFAANTLADLKAEAVVDASGAETGLDKPSSRFIIELLDGDRKVLKIGRVFQGEGGVPYVFAQVEQRPLVYVLKRDTVDKLRKAFMAG